MGHLPRLALLLTLLPLPAPAQEQVDQPDRAANPPLALAALSLRARVTRAAPAQPAYHVAWRRGGEGLGGAVIHGAFAAQDHAGLVPANQWSAPRPLADLAGKAGGWQFPTVVVSAEPAPAVGRNKPAPVPLTDVAVEFELLDAGQPVKSFTEPAPNGASVSLAIPLAAPDRPAFLAGFAGVSAHAKARRALLEKAFPQPAPMPRLFGVIGHLAGYGPGVGYGVRHNNPAVVADETATLALLGVNGLVGAKSVALADAATDGAPNPAVRHAYWGGPGSGSPMGFVTPRGSDPEDACPYDPRLAVAMADSVRQAIDEHHRIKADQSWALWWDEIGVAAKAHLQTCPRCREKFVAYCQSQKLTPDQLGAASWDALAPYPVFGKPGDKAWKMPAPAAPADGLRYYYTFRFLTEATAQLFPDSAKSLKAANILLYAMQGPTPSWAGHSLDWHEFYDRGANTAVVFETSNRDPRAWPFESYLADIARGICDRHTLPLGVLIKPHRGAVAQRMLSVVSRGATVIEWYTYGPDYAKGDSFSQSPDLLIQTAKAARFLGQNESFLYNAKPTLPARVAFCSPRSSEIWGKATPLGVTAFEDAKWVYLALRHAHIPVDVLSEQQLAEGNLTQYQTIYVVGPNLRRDAGAQLLKWVTAGGTLWTDALGLSRDEANQPAHDALTGLKARQYQSWGTVEPYKATDFKPITGTPPAEAMISTPDKPGQSTRALPEAPPRIAAESQSPPSVGRELLPVTTDPTAPTFADHRPLTYTHRVSAGAVVVAPTWAGLTYSAKVRRPDFDMSTDFSPADRALITAPAGTGPVTLSAPLVEPIPLANADRRAIALINWAYKSPAPNQSRRPAALVPAENLHLTIQGLGPITRARSATLGDLKLTRAGNGTYQILLPHLDEIDLITLE